MSVDFPADPAEPFWWGQVPCPYCGEREVSRSFRGLPKVAFVCMACGSELTVAGLERVER